MAEIGALQEKVIEGRPLTPEEALLLGVADDGVKQAIPRLNDSINRMITLSTAMIAGALGVLKDDVCTFAGRVTAATLFFLALATALLASIPYLSRGERELNSLASEVGRVTRWKRMCLWVCYGILLSGFLAAILGTALRT